MKQVKKVNIKSMTKIAILSSISIVLGITPLGFIPIGIARVTTMHIPVIIGGIVEGPFVGMMTGMIFGLFSMYQALTNPTPTSFVFLNPIVAIIPRVMIGLVSGYLFKVLKKTKVSTNINTVITSLLGSLTNTFGVLGLIYLLHGEEFVNALGLTKDSIFKVIMGIGLTNGIFEAIFASIVSLYLVRNLLKIRG